jgi:hypothetical protein
MLDGRQRDIDDCRVQHHHRLRDTDDDHHEPGTAYTCVSRAGIIHNEEASGDLESPPETGIGLTALRCPSSAASNQQLRASCSSRSGRSWTDRVGNDPREVCPSRAPMRRPLRKQGRKPPTFSCIFAPSSPICLLSAAARLVKSDGPAAIDSPTRCRGTTVQLRRMACVIAASNARQEVGALRSKRRASRSA